MRWPRRALAFAALGGVLVAAWAIARDVIWPNRHGAQIEHLSIDSRYVHRTLGVTVVLPANAGRGRPLLVFLHGRNGDEDSEMRNRAMFDELAQLGRRAPVIACRSVVSLGLVWPTTRRRPKYAGAKSESPATTSS